LVFLHPQISPKNKNGAAEKMIASQQGKPLPNFTKLLGSPIKDPWLGISDQKDSPPEKRDPSL
jgi:hypothetical protein